MLFQNNKINQSVLENNLFLSPWHSLPLRPSDSVEQDVFQAFIEITRGTTEKMEVDTTQEYNPVFQDLKKDRKSG